MSKLDIIAQSGVVRVYKVKSTGASTEPCGAPYESVTLFDRVSLFFLRIGDYFANKKKTKFEPGQIFHTKQKIYLLM